VKRRRQLKFYGKTGSLCRRLSRPAQQHGNSKSCASYKVTL
jgi:hypothetical protein